MTELVRTARVRVAGVLEGDAGRRLLADRVLSGGAVGTLRNRLREQILVTAGGERLKLDTWDAKLLGDEEVTHGPWSQFATDAALKDLVPSPPPPFAAVDLSTTAACAGDEVEVFGEVLENAIEEAGYRDTPEIRPHRIRALLVATGSDRKALLERAIRREYPAAKRQTSMDPSRSDPDSDRFRWPAEAYTGVVLFTIAIAIFVVVKLNTTWPTPHFVGALTLTLGLLVSTWPLRDVPLFREASAAATDSMAILAGARALILSAAFFGGVVTLFGSWIMLAAASAGLAFLALAAWTPGRDLGYAQRLLGAPPPGWTRIEGIVEDRTPITLDGHRLAFGLSPKEFRNQGTFEVRTPTGTFEIDPVHTMWASRVTIGKGDEASIVVPVGAKVVAAGRIAGNRLESEATIPALLFATGPDGAPLAVLRSVVRARAMVVVAELVLLAITLVMLAL